MTDEDQVTERRVSTPLVLALASAMVSVGVLGYLSTREDTLDPPPDAPSGPAPTHVDRSTAAACAESFLDAWRKRDHAVAEALSTGAAREEVVARRDREAAEDPEERARNRRLWDALARDRLSYTVERRIEGAEGGVTLSGVARGRFIDEEYARRVDFDLTREGGLWTVRAMRLGEVLTDTPQLLEPAPESYR